VAVETIKGLNLEIGGETTSLQTALSDVNKKSRDLQSELSRVEKLLKLDPTSTELLAQKQKLLAESVENTKDKLDRLKTAQEQINEQFKKGEINEGQYRAFQREIIKTEQELKKLEKNLSEVGQASIEMGSDVDKAGSKLNDLGDNAEKVGNKLKDVGETMSVGVTAPIVAGIALATEGTEEFRTELAKLETNAKMAGQGMEEVHAAMRKMQAVTGELDSNVEGLSNILAAGFKGEQLTALVDQLAGASLKFKDTLKFEGIADGLQETLATGAAIGPFAELLDRSGISLTTFNEGLKSAIKNGTQNQYILDVLAKEGLANVYEQYRKNNEELVKSSEATYEYQQAMADLGKELVPILTEIKEAVIGVVEAFNKLPEGTQDFITKSALILAAIGPLLFAFSQLAIGVSLLATAFGGGGAAAAGGAVAAEGAAAAGAAGGLSAAIAGIGAVLLPVIALIAAFAAGLFIGDTIMKLWGDDIINFATKLSELLNFLKTVFIIGFQQNIATIKRLWNDLATGFTEGIAAIKKAFSDFGDNIGKVFKALKDGIVDTWTTLWESVFGTFRNYITVIYTAVIDFANLILDKWDQFKFFLIDIWSGIYIGILEFINGIIDGINNMIKALNSIKFKVPDWVGGKWGGKEFSLDIDELKEFDTEKLTADSVKQKIEHTGRITIEGVNNKDELIASVDLIWDDLLDKIIQEVRG